MNRLFDTEKRFLGVGALAAVFALAPSLALGQEAATTEAPKPPPAATKARNIGVGAEAQTLPERVIRVRFPYKYYHADSGYDKDGKKLDLGLNLAVHAGGFVAEYGITDAVSVQVLIPAIYSNKMGLDADKFRASQTYKNNYDTFISKVAALLAAQGLCTSDCVALVEGGYALPNDTAVTLPTGETLVAKAGIPVKQYADALVVGQARQEAGKTGIGDMEIGVLYMFSDSIKRPLIEGVPVDAAIGLGIRLPTGQFKDVPGAYRGTGRGTTDLGIRTNLDYNPIGGLYISWQNLLETMLMAGEKERTSYLDNSKLSTADATTATAKAAGADGYKNKEEYKRKGARNIGFLKLGVGPGTWVEALKFWGVSGKWNYNWDSPTYLGGRSTGPRGQSQWVTASTTVSTLQYVASGDFPLPLDFDFDYDWVINGKNQTVAADAFSFTLKAYYKF